MSDTSASEGDARADASTSDDASEDTTDLDVEDVRDDSGNDAEDDGGFVGLNACGGVMELLLDGAPATPGEECGPCNDGVIVCADPDEVRCAAPTPTNACGTCGPLPGAPGEACGPCGNGEWACSDAGGMTCDGFTGRNACGGCETLDDRPGFTCTTVGGEDGTFTCAGPDALSCFDGGRNVCGGTVQLASRPGSPCGACGLGTVVCGGPDALECDESEAAANACGGCSPLVGVPGESCGACGTWACDPDDPERVVCEATVNACGGCAELAGEPGAACDAGTWTCYGSEEVLCTADPGNVCGGDDELIGELAAPCGECGDGVSQCASPNALACVGDTIANACGGCGVLSGMPGTSCGEGAFWRCVDGGAVSCEVEGTRNACGGEEDLEGEPGTTCDACETQRYACLAPDEVICLGSLNACGGCGLLTDADTGEIASPGADCGTCDSGRLTCTPSGDSLLCVGDLEEEAFLTRYPDADGDGLGDPGEPLLVCGSEPGVVSNNLDCDDSDETIGEPNACGGCAVFFEPGEGPGFPCGTCDTGRLACETDDGLRCVGDAGHAALSTYYVDADDDGFGDPDEPRELCRDTDEVVDNDLDCNDDDEDVWQLNPCGGCSLLEAEPGTLCGGCGQWVCASETSVECNTDEVPVFYRDADFDGFGDESDAITACARPDGYVDIGPGGTFDCDDANVNAFPDAAEVVGNGIDENCDTLEVCFIDFDGDGFAPFESGTLLSADLDCTAEEGEAGADVLQTDCDDTNADVNPDASETCNAEDDDCDGYIDDGFCDGSCTPEIVDDEQRLYVPCWVDNYEVAGAQFYSHSVLIEGGLTTYAGMIEAPVIAVSGRISAAATPARFNNSGNCLSNDGVDSTRYRVGGIDFNVSADWLAYVGGGGSGAGRGGPTDVGLDALGGIGFDTRSNAGPSVRSCLGTEGGNGGCSGSNGGGIVRLRATEHLDIAEGALVEASPLTRDRLTDLLSLRVDELDVRVETFPPSARISTSFEVEAPSSSGAGGTVIAQSAGTMRVAGRVAADGNNGRLREAGVIVPGLDGLPIDADAGVFATYGGGGGGHIIFMTPEDTALTITPDAEITVDGGAPGDGSAEVYRGEDGVFLELIDTDFDGVPDVCPINEDESDCDPVNPTIYPGSPEPIDGVDNDCDGWVDEDPGIGGRCSDERPCAEGVCRDEVCVPPDMRFIPAMQTQVGAASDELGTAPGERPVRMVFLTSPLAVGIGEVTQEEWTRYFTDTRTVFADCGPTCPVVGINWFEAAAYANARSEAEGLQTCYVLADCAGMVGIDYECSAVTYTFGSPYACDGYRLPTEAEWEGIYRAGTRDATYAGDLSVLGRGTEDPVLGPIAVYGANSEYTDPSVRGAACDWIRVGAVCGPQPIEDTDRNPFGIRGMAGNVYEWTADAGFEYDPLEVVDPTLPGSIILTELSERVTRGGSWSSTSAECRAANRANESLDSATNDIGFRLVRTLTR